MWQYNRALVGVLCARKNISDARKKFTIVIPPPNVTGSLHLGHALTNAIQDSIVRWKRMSGYMALWNPGCDHAGIATQVVVEKKLWREEAKTRHDIGRDNFVKKVWDWKNEKGHRIYHQLKKLGSSFDWDRAVFTMDPKMCKAVTEAFIRLHEDGTIYRANRLVNWSCSLKSAISDIEFAIHPFCARKLPIIVDDFVELDFGTGVVKITPAHDPNDYEVGKRHNLPFITIFDDEGNIAGDYGTFTGMKRFHARKKITEELTKLGLYMETKDNPMVVPICSRSKDVVEPMLKPQWYVSCSEMATKAVQAVENKELRIIPEQQVKTWNHWMEGIRDWCISRQLWWGHRIPAYFATTKNGKPLSEVEDQNWVSGHSEAEALQKAANKFNLEPEEFQLTQDEDVLDTWFSSALFPFSIFGWPEATQDLNVFYPTSLLETGNDILFFWVARMVFMGQKLLGKLPFKDVYLHPLIRDAHGRKMSKSLGNVVDPMDVIAGISLDDLHKQLYDSNLDPKEIDKAKAGQKQDYPNGIPECGTDALRFALCAMSSGKDINLNILRIQGYRVKYFADDDKYSLKQMFENEKFSSANEQDSAFMKIASNIKKNDNLDDLFADDVRRKKSASRLADAKRSQAITEHKKVSTSLDNSDFEVPADQELTGDESLMDLWMLSRAGSAVRDVINGFEAFDLVSATTAIYNLWLYDLCDVYLEFLKPVFTGDDGKAKKAAMITLYRTLHIGLRLLAPFMPFISEELYQRLPRSRAIVETVPSICVESFPEKEANYVNEQIEKEVDFVQKVAKAIRSARSDYNLPNKTKTEAYLHSKDAPTIEILKKYASALQTLAYCSKTAVDGASPEGCTIITVSDKCEVHLLLKGLIDPVKEIQKIQTKLDFLQSTKKKLEQAMNIENYATKVPPEVQQSNLEKLSETTIELERLDAALGALKLM
ncbi:hypothetical protein HUJ04_003343 [Dendroctonus ponderosae]|nr:hypothetical protein HUJ04_003343 [Dendroctonus ponderosae]